MLITMSVTPCNFYGFSTSVAKVLPAGSIKLYPNPTSGNFSLELGEYNGDINIIISDLSGRTLWNNDMQLSAYQPLSIEGLNSAGKVFTLYR